MKECEISSPKSKVAGQLKLYSFINSLLDDAFRLDFNHQDLSISTSELKLLLVHLQSNLKLLSDIKQYYINHTDSQKISGNAQNVQLDNCSEKEDFGKNYQQEIMNIIAKIEEGHFLMSPSLSFRMDNILPVLKLLCGKNLA